MKPTSWRMLLNWIRLGKRVRYQAPMDRKPVLVSARVTARGRGNRVLVTPPAGFEADPFRADSGHLDRFTLVPQ